MATSRFDPGIWGYAFGYFAAYVPYSATTKAITSGWVEGQEVPLSGFAVTPLSVGAGVIGMYVFLTAMGWWRYASRRTILGKELPSPTWVTLISGLLTAGIIITTTLAYTFSGVSIVFMMLLMRGGVLILAPIIDTLTGRKTRWFSWVGLGLSFAALIVAFSEKRSFDLTVIALADITIYLSCYFFRLRFMSRFAKKDGDDDASSRYFVEEQMVATPALLLLLMIVAFIGPALAPESGTVHDIVANVRYGFTGIFDTDVWMYVVFIGICSQFTGVFGGLVLLDKRENTYCVPVNRSSSIMAGVIASYLLLALYGKGAPSAYKLAGAALIIGAILFLTIPPMMEKKRKRDAEAAAAAAAAS